MSDSKHSTVTYTSVSEDDSDTGSPGVDGPPIMPEGPPSPNYVPGPEEPEQAPPSPIYIPFIPEPVYPKFLPVDDEEDPEEDDEEDPEEDPADYPTDRGDDDDDDAEEEEHLAPADPAAVAYSADQDPYLAYRVTARMSIRPQAPAPFLSEKVAKRLLALPTPSPSPLSPYSSPLPHIPSPPLPIPSPNGPTYVEGSLGSRAAGIRQRDALPSLIHETEMPEMCFIYRFVRGRVVLLLVLDTRSGRVRQLDELVGAIQDIAPTTLEGVNQRVIELATTVDQEDEIIYSQLDDARYDRALLRA
ncbi:hypothetical protein Tco_0688082 [Tanacetum coccineum]